MNKPIKPVTVTFPINRLGTLITSPGGISVKQAIAQAEENVEALREDAANEFNAALLEIERTLKDAADKSANLTERDFAPFLTASERILTVTGTFNFDLVDQIVKSLCDVVGYLVYGQILHLEAVKVHIRALRLCAPGGSLPSEQTQAILAELGRLHAHYRALCGIDAAAPAH